MYFPDLSPYRYVSGPDDTDQLPVLNVGWLDAEQAYRRGEVSHGFVERLWEYCRIRVEATRGLHECELCPTRSPGWSATRDDESLLLGSAEIRVFAEDAVFAAPNMVYHYVVDHGYLPPDEFVRAVLDGQPRPGSADYAALIVQHDPALAPRQHRAIRVNSTDRSTDRSNDRRKATQ